MLRKALGFTVVLFALASGLVGCENTFMPPAPEDVTPEATTVAAAPATETPRPTATPVPPTATPVAVAQAPAAAEPTEKTTGASSTVYVECGPWQIVEDRIYQWLGWSDQDICQFGENGQFLVEIKANGGEFRFSRQDRFIVQACVGSLHREDGTVAFAWSDCDFTQTFGPGHYVFRMPAHPSAGFRAALVEE
ncbi:MAG: hypothetical protein ABIB61_01825 [Candidatus Shapirobacteria bacterium]